MCLGVAYWAGISKIFYAVSKSKVSGDYYETKEETSGLFKSFNRRIEIVHLSELEEEALKIIREWERRAKV